ncbi:MAG: Gfo/Idh/MocA family oxidoreductase [Lentisphaerae bacterium]|nr:Gfo/Idh/MocA family oxidoreductase [Lentisphaerota bacterium]
MKKWKVGIVGLRRGMGFVNVFGAHPDVEVSALCDLDEKKLTDLGSAFNLDDSSLFTDFDDFVNADMDIVMIATPIRCHTEQTIKSLQAGKHVLCEQTVAYTVEECEAVFNAVKQTGKSYMMAENYCYFQYVREWQKIIDQGKLGKIYYAEGEYIHEIMHLMHNKDTDAYYWRHERPPIWYCAHTLGPVLTLMDDRIVRACGMTSGFTRRPEFKDHPGFLDFQIGLFETAKGAVVKILRSQTAARPHTVWYSLYGTKGHLENERDTGNGLYFSEDELNMSTVEFSPANALACPVSDKNAPAEAQHGGHGTSEYYLIRDFIDSLNNNVRPPIDIVRSLDFTIPGIIAHQSSMQNGKWLDVPIFDW